MSKIKAWVPVTTPEQARDEAYRLLSEVVISTKQEGSPAIVVCTVTDDWFERRAALCGGEPTTPETEESEG